VHQIRGERERERERERENRKSKIAENKINRCLIKVKEYIFCTLSKYKSHDCNQS
jgi:hypothetical protein